MKKIIILLFSIFFLSLPLLCQEREREIQTIKTDEAIIVDGLFTESIWDRAPDAARFIQEPLYRRESKKINTIVKILYDDSKIYFGILCYDTEPDKIEIGPRKIDEDLRDADSIYFLIDPFVGNVYFYFGTDLAGSLSDGAILKGRRDVNYDWKGAWESVSQKTDFGWSSEIAIELSCLSKEPEKLNSLGLCVARVVPRLDISIFKTNPMESAFNIDELRDLRILTLFEGEEQVKVEQGLDLQLGTDKRARIIPHAITKVGEEQKNELGAGIDASYAFSPQINGQLTIYPDFDTVEPDYEQFNLTPFELYLPEKRSFFQQDSNLFQQPFRLFYSKRIGDIYGGVNLNGGFGSSQFSLLSAQTIKEKDLNIDSANFSVLSFQNIKVLNVLSFGFSAANKLVGKENTGTAGVNARLDISDKLRFSGQFALSYGSDGKNYTAFFLGPSFDSKTFHIHLFYRQIDKNFGDNANAVGFIPDDNRKELDSAINMTFPFRKGIFERIRYRSNYNVYWGLDGTLRSWQIDEGLHFDIKNDKFSLALLYTLEYMLNEGYIGPKKIYIPSKQGWANLYTKNYKNNRATFSSSFFNGEWQQFGLIATVGKNYGSNFYMIGFTKKLKVTDHIFSEYDLYRIRYQSESLYNSTYIHILKLTFLLTKNLTGKFFFQSNSDIKKSNIHVVCSYSFIPPFGTIQLIYQKGTGEFGERGNQGHTLFLKVGYMF